MTTPPESEEEMKMSDHVLVPQSAIDWLMGSGPDPDGNWFGSEAYNTKPSYWWRSVFQKMIGQKLVYDKAARTIVPASPTSTPAVTVTEEELHGLDTAQQVLFYEQDFYVLSNFSSFRIYTENGDFPTSEHAYHYEKFIGAGNAQLLYEIRSAKSAHEAFKIAERHKHQRRDDWDTIKLTVMRKILRFKVDQHEYVRRKLLATGDRELIENSWRDDFWGWGPNRDGQNMLGKLWMEVRDELRSVLHRSKGE